jgi:hypothetical protein
MWNIDEKEYRKIADSAWAKSRTGKYGDYSSQSPNGTFKNLLSVMTTALWLQYQYEFASKLMI